MMPGSSIDLSACLTDALIAVVPGLRTDCRDAWTVIGSAAAYLAGAAVTVADLDVLTSMRDAEIMTEHWQAHRDVDYVPADDSRFRSRFARFHFGELPVEVMGGLELRETDDWVPVRVDELVHVPVAGVVVPIPSIAEQIRVLESFGRSKDRLRAELLKALHTRGF